MPREILTDEKVLEKCMEGYPLPFALVDKVLSVGTKKEDNGFMPFSVQKRKPNPPEKQEYLANAILRARRNIGQQNNRNELEKIRSMVLRDRPNYPDYVRNVKEEVEEDIDIMDFPLAPVEVEVLEEKEGAIELVREPDEPVVEQLKKDDEDTPEAEAREVIPEAQVVPKRKRRTKKEMEEEKRKKRIEEGKQETIPQIIERQKQGQLRGAKQKKNVSQLKAEEKRLKREIQLELAGADQDLVKVKQLQNQLDKVESQLQSGSDL
jgi:hypothetical protein